MQDYHLSDRKRILGDLENSGWINIIILNTTKVSYLSKLEGTLSSTQRVQSSTNKSSYMKNTEAT